MVVKDVNYDSENDEWDNMHPPQMLTHDSKDSSNEESNTESNDEEDLEFKPVFAPQGDQTPVTIPISDAGNSDEGNIGSPQLGHGKHQQFQ